jgi:alpha-ketoglutarate-dependent 2,4-dichlorophenoxyacetate dioxygenase
MLATHPLHPLFGAELSGVDLRAPLGAADAQAIRDAFNRYGVCVFHNDPPLTNQQHIALSYVLGPLDNRPVFKIAGRVKRIQEPEIQDVGNLNADGSLMTPDSRIAAFRRGDRLWHSDMSFHENRATFSLLSAHSVPPEGGDTLFADMRVAYAALPDSMKARIDNLVCEHSIWWSRALANYPTPTQEELDSRPPVHHPLVFTHAGSGRKTVYLSSHISHVVGMPMEEGRALIRELMAHATQPEFVHSHRWRVGDVVAWDNLATMHRGTEFADTVHPRDMRRTTLREHAA